MVNNEKAITTMNTLLTHEEEGRRNGGDKGEEGGGEEGRREGGEEGELVQFPPQSL